MGAFKDITGLRFGRLVALYYTEGSRKKPGKWTCKCDCGNIMETLPKRLKSGMTKSCGCLVRDTIQKIATTHGKYGTPIYRSYASMIDRCTNSKCKAYKNYGKRGITICHEWKNDFMEFYNWAITNGYNDGLTIERVNVNGNYEPSNCKWITQEKQCDNKTNTRYCVFKGEKTAICVLAKQYNIKCETLARRIKNGWDVEDAISKPIQCKFRNKRGNYEIEDISSRHNK